MANKIVYLNRRYKFSAAHRLFNQNFSDAENVQIFKNCSNPTGHGHNFKLIVTLKGPIDHQTGMVMNLKDLDPLIESTIIELFDHQYLNYTNSDLKNLIPTSENLLITIWNLLVNNLKGTLYKMTLYETPRNYFEYYGPSSDLQH